jgi:MFS family permease
MPVWKRNLIVCWFGLFVYAIGMSQIAPVLPLIIRNLGVHNTALIDQFSGIAFGVTYIVTAIASPIWGQAADKYGRKPMLVRASLGMAILVCGMAFTRNVYELIGLRVLQGAVSGYGTACITLIATQTDKEHAGWALGILSTSNLAGSLLGPMIGGCIAEYLGLQNVFYITGALLLLAFITTVLFVQESFTRQDKQVLGVKEIWSSIPEKSLTIVLMVTYFVLTLALYSIEPIITVYVIQLSHNASNVALLSGMAFSATGLASIIAAPRLGKLSDQIGAQKVMLVALVASGLMYIPQAFVKTPWQLMGLRFLLGLATAGLMPAINALIKIITPDSLTGRVFGISMTAGYLGVFGGCVFGGEVAAFLGFRDLLFIASALMLLNAVWVYFKVYKKLSPKIGGISQATA